MEQQFVVTSQAAGQRLDLFCVAKLPGFSRAAIQKAIKAGQVTVNGVVGPGKKAVREGDTVSLRLASLAIDRPLSAEAMGGKAATLTIPTLYEDREVVVINKPAGVIMYSLTGEPTVATWFLKHYDGSPFAPPAGGATAGEPSSSVRPGIVHRLDKETSGVVVLAKTPEALQYLLKQFKERRPKKEYLALVFGVLGEKKGRITRDIARSKRNPMRRAVVDTGKDAITEWQLEEKLGDFSLLRVWPLTGRMHQIRAHLHWLGFPVVGDALYTIRHKRLPAGTKRQLLHAEKLTVKLPSGAVKTFIAPLPEDFADVLRGLRNA